MTNRWKLLAGGVAISLVVAVPVALAGDRSEGVQLTQEITEKPNGVAEHEAKPDELDFEDGEFETEVFELFGPTVPFSEEEIAEVNQLLADLAAHLDEAGIEHGEATITIPTWDIGDEAANEAVKDFFLERGLFGFDFLFDEVVPFGFDFPEGFPFEEFPEGFEFPEAFPFEAFPEGFEFPEVFPFDGEFHFDFELPERFLEEFDLGELPVPENLVDSINAQADDLAAFLEERGIEREVVEGPLGIRWVEWDFADPAAEEAVKEFFKDRAELLFGFEGPFGEGLDELFDDFGFPFTKECHEEPASIDA